MRLFDLFSSIQPGRAGSTRGRFASLPVELLALSAVILLGTSAGRAAETQDRAVVVGADNYPSLKNADLKGCVSDANTIADALKKYGFQVQTLANPGRSEVVGALREAAAEASGAGRFVFYFAGQGVALPKNGGAAILPSDARTGDLPSFILAGDLAELAAGVPARSHTVLIDASFSGGMIRPVDAKQRRPGSVRICYFTSSRADEGAGEDDFEGQPHGVFSHELAKVLLGQKNVWGELRARVAGSVTTYMANAQHPQLSEGFDREVVFEDSASTARAVARVSVLTDFNAQRPDAAELLLRMSPDNRVLGMGERLSFTASIGSDGYLALMEQGPAGVINLLYPRTRAVDDARVRQGQIVRIPDIGKEFSTDAVGGEKIKAILFTSRERAEALLSGFGAGNSLTEDGARLALEPQSSSDTFYTGELRFEVKK